MLGPLVAWAMASFPGQYLFLGGVILALAALLFYLARNYTRSLYDAFEKTSAIAAAAREQVASDEEKTAQISKLEHEVRSGAQALVKAFQVKERNQTVLDAVAEGVITTDESGIIDYLNPIAETLTGWPANDATDRSLSDVFRVVDGLTRSTAANPAEQCINSRRVIFGTDSDLLVRRDNVEYAVEYAVSPIRERSGEITGSVVVFRDVTEKRKIHHQISWKASHDHLTGLINRAEFERRLDNILGQREHRQHALCLLDLDKFKIVNDSCGHLAGDELLRKLSQYLRLRIRGTDTLARIGGDEFGVLLYGCAIDKAKLLAEELRQYIGAFSFEWEGENMQIEASIGIVEIDSSWTNINDLLHAADAALYAAKEGGRCRVHLYTPEDEKLSSRDGGSRWVRLINRALEENRFCLYQQQIWPINGVDSGEACELLLRLRDDQGRIVTSSDFLAAAERYHLLTGIDRWVVKAAFRAIQNNHSSLEDMAMVSINLSGQSIADDRFMNFVVNMLEETGIPGERICFEITETDLIANVDRSRHFISSLKNHGCKFAMDDFGAALSAINYLKLLPVDFVKIDSGFVRNIMKESVDYELVLSINRIAHILGKKTTAKLVDDRAVEEVLRQIGVDFLQGNYIEEPHPVDSGEPRTVPFKHSPNVEV
jgi:diguanylate cyclase (GGDEF)-like protein/PAS domain S-box-containing protein